MSERTIRRRDFLRLAAGTAAAVVLAACQPKAAPDTTQPVGDQAGKAAAGEKIVIHNMVWGASASMIPMYEMFAEAFREANPNLSVEYLYQPGAQFIAQLKTMEAAGTLPDVLMPIGGAINTFRGPDFSIWLDLNPYVERDGYDLSDIVPHSINSAKNPFNQNLEGIAIQNFTGFITYNKDLFAEAGLPEPPHEWGTDGWDHKALLDTAIKLTKDKNGKHPGESGFDPANIETWGIHGGGIDLWGHIFGGEALRTDGQDRRNAKVDSPAFVEGTQFWQDMMHKLYVEPRPFEVQEIQGTLPGPFHTGRVGMHLSNTWDINSFRGITDFKLDFAAGPHGVVRDRYWGRLCNDYGCITADSKNHDAAWSWISYVSSPGMAERFSVDLRQCLPARMSVVGKYADRLAGTFPEVDGKVVSDALERCTYLEYWSPPTEWSEIWNPYVDQIRFGEAPTAQVLPEAKQKVQENWDEYYARFNM
jgi:ABC-type glycerol-3-phosphate transport system substrate-binding protein